jgi:epoxyqueuosine reductase
MRPPAPLPSIGEVRAILATGGITHVGVTSAELLGEARSAIEQRLASGFDAGMGFTFRDPARSTDPRRAVVDATSVIVAARPYRTPSDGPPHSVGAARARVARYAWVDHYAPLRAALRDVARAIRRAGHRAVAFADDNSMVDRAIAHRAGLGWYGKNANLLLPGAGSWFVLGSVVTTAWYAPTPGPAPDGCGSCVRCIDDCPTGAIVEPGVIDANRCLSWVLQKPGTIPVGYREAIGDRIYGCDDCQETCPVTVRLGARHTVAPSSAERSSLPVLELLEADDDGVEQRCGHWYIAGREMRWVRRNALVVLGNVGDPCDDAVRRAVERYRADIDPILAEHANWARDRLDARAAASTPAAT